MNPYAATIVLAVLAVLQTTVMPYASLGNTRPLLPLLAVISWGLHRGAMAGAWWAVAAGLMLDLLSPAPFGTYTVPLVSAAAVVALVGGQLFPTNLALPVTVVAASTVTFTIVQRTILDLRGDNVAWSIRVLGEELLPAVALNLLWLPVLFFPLRALARAARPRIEWEH